MFLWLMVVLSLGKGVSRGARVCLGQLVQEPGHSWLHPGPLCCLLLLQFIGDQWEAFLSITCQQGCVLSHLNCGLFLKIATPLPRGSGSGSFQGCAPCVRLCQV